MLRVIFQLPISVLALGLSLSFSPLVLVQILHIISLGTSFLPTFSTRILHVPLDDLHIRTLPAEIGSGKHRCTLVFAHRQTSCTTIVGYMLSKKFLLAGLLGECACGLYVGVLLTSDQQKYRELFSLLGQVFETELTEFDEMVCLAMAFVPLPGPTVQRVPCGGAEGCVMANGANAPRP